MRTTEEADATVVPVQKNNHYRQEPVPTQKIQQQQQRLFHSSCEISYRSIGDHFLAVAATTLVTDRIKNQLLEHAVQDDSPLWQQPPSRKPPSITSPHPHTNSKNTARKDDMEIHDTDEEDDIDIDIPTVAHLWDPLNDLDVSAQSTRYWPHLPIANPMNVPSRNIDPFVLCQEELSNISHDIRKDLLGTDHPVLHLAANYFFNNNTTTTDSSGGGSGKKFRPLLVHLMAKALQQAAATAAGQPPRDNHPTTDTIDKQVQQLQHQQQNRRYARLAEISELIHTASLFHDDVIDNADTRRGRPTVHAVFGDKMAILAGDYLLARASIGLARLRNVKVVETMSTIIEHLVRGEVMQMKGNSSTNSDKNSVQDRMDYYLRKNFYKTGSLMANSCRSTAILGNYPEEWVDLAYRYGKHTGMAFQLVDDILDFEGSASHMGKPALADLHSGVATAPVLFAAEEYPDQLIPLLDRKFANPGDVELALELVMASSGMDRTRQLARVHAEMAMDAILELTPHETNPDTTLYRDSLVQLAYKVVARTK